MENIELRGLIRSLIVAFKDIPKPEPLSSFENSYDHESVAVFNSTDWENATYVDFCYGMEGWIICSPETRVYLTPFLLKILLLKKDGEHEGAADNLSFELLPHLETSKVFRLMNHKQMSAVFNAVAYIDHTRWYPSGSDAAGDLARCWGFQYS